MKGKKNKALEMALWNIEKGRKPQHWRTRKDIGDRPISLIDQKEAYKRYKEENGIE